MSDEWCRMRLKPTTSKQTLLELIEIQAQAFQEYGKGFVDDLQPFNSAKADNDEAKQCAVKRYGEASKSIYDQVTIDDDTEEYRGCFVMSIIGRNTIFPYMWRIEAYRSFLPEQVPGALEKWKTYIEAVRAGRYTTYLLEWHLYVNSHRAFDFWQELQFLAQRVIAQDDWAHYLKSDAVPKEILQFPAPSKYPPPIIDNVRSAQTADWQHDERYIQLLDIYKRLNDLRHAWNRNAKKKGIKAHRGGYPIWDNEENFDNFIKEAHGSQIDDLFAWLQRCVDDGVGLYLSV